MNNEEKILALLEKQGKMLEKQNIIVEQLHKTQLEQGMKMVEQSAAIKSLRSALEDQRQLSQRTAVLLETEYRDRLQLLYEGHKTIMDKLNELTPKTRVEVLEDTVEMLKDVIKLLRQEVNELKKAQ